MIDILQCKDFAPRPAMTFYLRDLPQGGTQLWKIEGDTATCLDVTNMAFTAEPGEDVWHALRRLTPWFEPPGTNPFHELALRPGEFYPRMARPLRYNPAALLGLTPGPPIDAKPRALATGQLTTLTRRLARICETVHSVPETLDVFGHEIRNLLILASTEVESHWRAVLIANNVAKQRYSTADYVRLQEAMKLGQYAVALPSYPWLEPLRPFEDWGHTAHPTQELAWYDAYNAVKHSREDNFKQGTLRHVLEAVSACLIMTVAQFGGEVVLEPGTEIAAFYAFTGVPDWPLNAVYVHPCGESLSEWAATAYPDLAC